MNTYVSSLVLLALTAPATAQITVHQPGYQVTTVTSGGLLDQPTRMRFGPDGRLYVSNSGSVFSGSNPGSILCIDPDGTQSVYFADPDLAGPFDLDFNPGTSFGVAGELFVSLEDYNEWGLGASDPVVSIPTGGGSFGVFATGAPLGSFNETTGLRFGFGGQLHAVAKTLTDNVVRLYRVDAGGASTLLTVMSGGAEATGFIGLEFGPGGAFGSNLYLTTQAAQGAAGALNALYTYDAAGSASLVVDFGADVPGSLAFGGGAGTTFGDCAYVSMFDTLNRVEPSGGFTTFASISSGSFYGLAMSPDGEELFICSPVLNSIFKISAGPSTYCTAGTSASGCQASLSASGLASASAASGFDLSATGVESAKDGLFFFGTSGRQANPWGNGSSYQCVVPPVKRAGLLLGSGTSGQCDGAFVQDLNALWCPSCPKPGKNPGAGALVQAQLWYRDPQNTSNQTTSLSNAIEFPMAP